MLYVGKKRIWVTICIPPKSSAKDYSRYHVSKNKTKQKKTGKKPEKEKDLKHIRSIPKVFDNGTILFQRKMIQSSRRNKRQE